jgi:hypothetical protein
MSSETNLITKEDCDKHTNNFNKKMEDLKQDLNDFKIEIIKEIAAIPEKLENKFAPKWVGDVMKFVMAGVGLAMIGALMALILK